MIDIPDGEYRKIVTSVDDNYVACSSINGMITLVKNAKSAEPTIVCL